jgi:hypothetical protein
MSSVINETLLAIKAAFEAGVNIFNGGTAVSSSNPLPINSTQLPTTLGQKLPSASVSVVGAYGSFNVPEVVAGRSHKLQGQAPAVSGQFGRIQIANPANSVEYLVINALSVWAGTAGTYTYSAYEIPIANVGTLISNADTCYKIGSPACSALVYYANSATAITTTGLVAGGQNASIASSGSSILYANGNIYIPAGKCIEIVIGTANIVANMQCQLYALPTA